MDPTGLELIAQELQAAPEIGPEGVRGTEHEHGRAVLTVAPEMIGRVLARLRARGFGFLASVHGLDYHPEEPRLGVLYELLDMDRCERLAVRLRLSTDSPEVDSVTPDWPTANHQEREVYDMFGVIFRGHPDLRRILMPEDYEGYPQRRDFPVGGEPVLFTYNDTATLGSPE